MTLSRLKLTTTCRKLIVPILCSYLLFQACSCFKQNEKRKVPEEGISETGLEREAKNLFPFVWVTFQASPCGTNNDGVCVQRGKCTKKGGTMNGNCQDGFGECCMFSAKCDENTTTIDVNNLVTVLDSPVQPNTQCTFRFRKEPNICQIRLDFDTYNSAGADSDGMCVSDRLRITNSITIPNDFTTCGDLTGQHMYLTFGNRDTIEVSPILQTSTSRYKIIATRIPCDSKNRAPDYCLQYFTKPMDRVKSFDFGRQQQDKQKYTVCVKPMGASESVSWKPCTGVTGKNFDIITNLQAAAATCDTDWIQVKGRERVCEPFLELKSDWKPYELLVNFDDREFPDPPPGFNIPVDPANCAAGCIGQPPAYTCACLDNPTVTNQICQCVVAPGPAMNVDFNNTGFCLDYTQL